MRLMRLQSKIQTVPHKICFSSIPTQVNLHAIPQSVPSTNAAAMKAPSATHYASIRFLNSHKTVFPPAYHNFERSWGHLGSSILSLINPKAAFPGPIQTNRQQIMILLLQYTRVAEIARASQQIASRSLSDNQGAL